MSDFVHTAPMRQLMMAQHMPERATVGSQNLVPALIYLSIAPVFWGGNFVVGRFIGPDFSPFWLNFLRWTIAAIVLLPFGTRPMIRELHLLRSEIGKIAVLSLIGIVGVNTLIYLSLRHATATEALIGFSLSPFLILIMLAIFERHRPKRTTLLAASISLVGVALAVSQDVSQPFQTKSDWRLISVLSATFVWSLYCVALKKIRLQASALSGFLAQILVGLVMQTVFAVMFLNPPNLATITGVQCLSILYLGIFAAAAAFMLWHAGIRAAGAAKAGVFVNIMPLSGIVFAWLILGETIGRFQIAGVLLIFLGVLLNAVFSFRSQK